MSGGRSRRKKLVRSKRLSKTDSEVEQENINAAQSSEAATEDTTEGAAAAASETNQEEPVQTSSTEAAAEGAEAAQAVTEAEEISEILDLQTGSSELEQLPPPLETVTVPEEIRESVEKLRKNLEACEDLALSDNLEGLDDLDDTDAEVPPEAGKCISQKKK